MSVGQPLQDIALVELPNLQGPLTVQPGNKSAPHHCVLLRAGGLLSLLDMESGE